MREERDSGDAIVARLAAGQHGVVTTPQLRACGIDKSAVGRRLRKGTLHRLYRGVYAVGHPGLSRHGHWLAAVFASGNGAILSHGSAAVLWGLLRPIEGPIHVSVPTQARRRGGRGIVLHRCETLSRDPQSLSSPYTRGKRLPLVTRRDGIPVTSVARTVDDLRGTLPPRLVRRARRQAELMGVRLGGAETDRSRSDVEADFLRLCRRHGLPAPKVNVRVGRWEVDFLWPRQRLAVETDTFTYHRGSVAFEDDHARDLDLRARGYVVLRFTDLQLREEPGRVAADVARALTLK